jgi:hypothetical protein
MNTTIDMVFLELIFITKIVPEVILNRSFIAGNRNTVSVIETINQPE